MVVWRFQKLAKSLAARTIRITPTKIPRFLKENPYWVTGTISAASRRTLTKNVRNIARAAPRAKRWGRESFPPLKVQ